MYACSSRGHFDVALQVGCRRSPELALLTGGRCCCNKPHGMCELHTVYTIIINIFVRGSSMHLIGRVLYQLYHSCPALTEAANAAISAKVG